MNKNQTSNARCAGCPQEHYKPDPPTWWTAHQGAWYCILCSLKRKLISA